MKKEYIIVDGIKYKRTDDPLTISERPNQFEEADKIMDKEKKEKEEMVEKANRHIRPTCIDYPDCHSSCRANCYD